MSELMLIPMTVTDILVKARRRVDNPQKWISWWSVSDDGKRLDAGQAVAWASGYESAHAMRNSDSAGNVALHLLAEQSGINRQWSDYDRVTYLTIHREVMAMFDKAITALEAHRTPTEAPDAGSAPR